MNVLIEYNNYLEKNLIEVKKENLSPIILFKISFNNKKQVKQDLEKIKEQRSKINEDYFAILINLEKYDSNFTNIINQLKDEFNLVIGQGGLNKTNTFFIEQSRVDFLLDPQSQIQKPKLDFIHHFNSGLNHIQSRYLKNKEIGLIFTLNNSQNKYHIKEIGRINQNIKFARKYKVGVNINYIVQKPNQIKSKIELNGIYSIFNISNDQKKESLNILEKKIKENIEKNSKNYITKGIELE